MQSESAAPREGAPSAAPTPVQLVRGDLRSQCPPERWRAIWVVRFAVAGLTVGINGLLAAAPPAFYDPEQARHFFWVSLPYAAAASVALALHLTGRWRSLRLQRLLSLGLACFEAGQVAVSLSFMGVDHAVTLAYALLMVTLFAIFIDGVHGLWALIALAAAVSAPHALLMAGLLTNGQVFEGGRPQEAAVLGQAAWQALLLLAVTWMVGAFTGARMRWQQARLEQQNTFITQQILRRYLPVSLVEDLLAHGDAWQKPRRLEATIFFSDLVGFTRQAEKLPVETLSESLDAYLTQMVEAAHAHGGTIDKFIGDAVMVIFGAPVPCAPEEQARRAVAMALDMQARTRRLHAQWAGSAGGFEPVARMGIHFGEVVVGNFGGPERSDFTAVGDNVNVASRLEGACRPGRVLVSDAVWALLGGSVAGSCLGETRVKNKDRPVVTWEIAEQQEGIAAAAG